MIDEIEKGLAGMSGDGGGDSGTGSRVFGTLLSWMSDKTAYVFVVATANQFDRLLPKRCARDASTNCSSSIFPMRANADRSSTFT